MKMLQPGLVAIVLRLGIVLVSFVIGANLARAQFDGAPSSPQAFSTHGEFANWDVQLHSRDADTWINPEPINGQHGPDCSGPPASHPVTTYENMVYVCNEHLMTAIKADGYGIIYLTPNQLLNCSGGSCSVQWEMSTLRMSDRDWPDVWITPYEYNLALPFESTDPDLQGPPQRAVNLTFNTSQFAPVLKVFQSRQLVYENFENGPLSISPTEEIVAGTNQAAVRQTLKLTLTRGHAKFERLESATAPYLLMFEVDTPAFPMTDSMVVQFGHHSYNPTKDNAGVPATWHWDNFTLSPSVPFTIIRATQRRTTGGMVTFVAPAPENAMLRFSAVGQVTLNGRTVAPMVPTIEEEHHNSYFVPIEAGAKQVLIGLEKDSQAKDFSIWARKAAGQSLVSDSSPAPVQTTERRPSVSPPNTGDGGLLYH